VGCPSCGIYNEPISSIGKFLEASLRLKRGTMLSRLAFIKLLFFTTALILLVACGGESQNAGTSTPKPEMATKAQVEPTSTITITDTQVRATTVTSVSFTATPTLEAKVETTPSSTNVISWEQGKAYIGARIPVCGPVVDTNTDRGSRGNPTTAYLYIGKPSSDPARFVVKITGKIRTEFTNRDPETYYLGKNICITGLIKEVIDQQEGGILGIIVENPTQITVDSEVSPTNIYNPKPTATPLIVLWAKDYSFSKTPIESSNYIKGVNTDQWKTIGEIGDSANCERRVAEITNITNANTITEELHKKDIEAIHESVKWNEFTVLTSGTYALHKTLSIGSDHKLIGQGEITLLANNVDVGIKLDSGSISGLTIMNAGNEGIVLQDNSLVHNTVVGNTGVEPNILNSSGAGISSNGSNSANNCVVSVEVFNSYNDISSGGEGSSTWAGGNADGLAVKYGAHNITFIDAHSHHNSDDGYDFWKGGDEAQIENDDVTIRIFYSTANHNGKNPLTSNGDGNGFKFGSRDEYQPPKKDKGTRFIYGSAACYNKANGFDRNGTQMTIVAKNLDAQSNGGSDHTDVENFNNSPDKNKLKCSMFPISIEFEPSLEKRYEVSVEEAIVYGTGGTLDGGQVELLLDLAIPDTGTDGPRPLLVHIHGGGFARGSRWTQWDAAERGWVAASIDYRLAGDEPLPGQRVKEFFDAIGGESSSARDRSVVASVEDTLAALDYLLSRADELSIDTNRIVLKGESAGAFIALAVAYCADKFEISGPVIAAVIDFSGGIPETFCGGGTAIDPGEAAVFLVHGTEEVTFTTRALPIVDGAMAAGITYEFYPLEGVGHEWLLGMLGQTTADGRKIDDLMYEFLNRVLYDE
jgi:predicted esterase